MSLFSIVAIFCGTVGLCLSLAGMARDGYVIILLMSDGSRKTLPARRFTVPTANQIREVELSTRTDMTPRGSFVCGWFRLKR